MQLVARNRLTNLAGHFEDFRNTRFSGVLRIFKFQCREKHTFTRFDEYFMKRDLHVTSNIHATRFTCYTGHSRNVLLHVTLGIHATCFYTLHWAFTH